MDFATGHSALMGRDKRGRYARERAQRDATAGLGLDGVPHSRLAGRNVYLLEVVGSRALQDGRTADHGFRALLTG